MSKSKPPTSTVIRSDCLDFLSRAPEQGAHLVIADPPYNIGMQYADYHDKKEEEDYLAWMEQWLTAVKRVLHEHGSLWVIVPDEWADDVGVFCKRELGLHRRNWVIWYYTFGQNCKNKFNRSHTHIHYYTKHSKKFQFDPLSIKVPSARQIVYSDKRAKAGGKLPDDTWVLLRDDVDALLDPVGDVWSASRVCGTFAERRDVSPNQIPLPIIERIVLSCSLPGDMVLDPFVGTGTTAEACAIHGRHFAGCDISEACVEVTKRRVDEAVQRIEEKEKHRQLYMFE